MTDGQRTERGTLFTTRLDDLQIRYLSGRDVDANTPVFDMSAGEVVVENIGESPISLRYDSMVSAFDAHHFTLGANQEDEFHHPHSEYSEPSDLIAFVIAPGQSITISRQDYMSLYETLGRARLRDGTMCTRYAGLLTVNEIERPFHFGPHCFYVDLDRDWDEEMRRYLQFFADRDSGG